MKKLHILLSLLIVFTSTLLFTACFGEKPPPETFSISGYVYDGEIGVEGVSLISDVGTVQTDENGYYSFKGLTTGITITAEKENYMFVEKSKTFFTETESANFAALPYYNVQGFVKSGEVGIEGVKLTASGPKGGFTYSTTNGAFVLYNVAGEVKITAEKQGYVFFEKTINKANATDVVINATTSITGLIEFVGESAECQDSVKVFVGEDEISLDKAKFSAANIKLGTIIKPVCKDLVFEPQQVIVMQENQDVKFVCQKLFDCAGYVRSGDYPISNAQIKCGEQIVESQEDGSFILTNLVGSVEIEVTHKDFVFEKTTINETSDSIILIGTKSVKGEVVFVDSPLKNVEVKCGTKTTYTNNSGKFVLENVCVGDEVELLFDGYKLEPNKFFVTSESQDIVVSADKIYDAQISVQSESGEGLSDVIINIGKQQYTTNSEGVVEISSITGEHNIVCEKQGYFIECIEKLSYLNSEIIIIANPYYDAYIRLHSGSIVLTHTICSVDGIEYTSDTNGEFVIENLIEGQQCEVYCNGYNPQNIVFDINNNIIDVNLSYNISGVIVSGSANVDNAKIFNESVTVFSNREGKFSIDSLYGENVFSVEKLDYVFENGFSVSSEKFDIVIDSTYSIYGITKNETDFLTDIDIVLTNYETEQSQTIKTDENGRYVFSGVSGYNLLFYSTSLNLKLRPSSYDVSQSGQYDFMLNGFELGGTVLCGDVGVEGVLMSAGANKTYTDKNGYYYFSLLTSDCSIVAQKQGYEFTPSTINVTSDDNARTDVNFVATYKVEGTIYCGQQKVSDVKVSIGDKVVYTNANGYFEITGIDQKLPILLEKENYQFECQEYVDGYVNLVIQSNFSITGIVKSGDVLIDGAIIKYNDKEIETQKGGLFKINGLVAPTKLYISKLGYAFESEYIVTQPTELEINATYSITGIVKSSNAPISGVCVKYNDKTITTDDYGMFKVSGLSGSVTLSFEKEGYIFEDEIVSMPCDLQIYATFSVNGRVVLNGVGLAAVQVSCQGKSTTTDSNGYFMITGLSGEGTLELIRRGYTFNGDTYFDKSTTLNFTALYSLVGKVYSGDMLLKDVQVLVGEIEVLTKDDGSFEIVGLSDSISVVYKKTGFNQITKTYSDFTEDIIIDMSYNITIKLVGNTGTDATITVKDFKETKTLKTKEQSLTVSQIFGNTILSFEKQGFMFAPSQIGVSGPGVVTTTLSEIYTINGKVTVQGTSIPVIGMKLSVGGQSAYTNASGEYSVSNLMGTTTLVGQLDYAGCTTITTESKQISGTGEHNFSIPASQYAYFLFERGYKLLDNAKSSYVTVEGKLSLTMGGDQTIRGIRKRDSKGNIFTEKINYGDTVLSIDPKVSLLTYYNINTREVKIQQTKNVSDAYVPTYENYTDSSVDEYKTKYGVYPYDNYAYIINQSTVSSITDLSYGDGKTVFTMNLNANTSITNYKIQMTALSGQTPNKFNHVKLTYTIDNNGYINTLDINEQYVITVGLSVTATAAIKETFLVRDANTVLTDVDINDIRGSLTYQEKPMAASNVLLPQVAQFDSKRRKR